MDLHVLIHYKDCKTVRPLVSPWTYPKKDTFSDGIFLCKNDVFWLGALRPMAFLNGKTNRRNWSVYRREGNMTCYVFPLQSFDMPIWCLKQTHENTKLGDEFICIIYIYLHHIHPIPCIYTLTLIYIYMYSVKLLQPLFKTRKKQSYRGSFFSEAARQCTVSWFVTCLGISRTWELWNAMENNIMSCLCKIAIILCQC